MTTAFVALGSNLADPESQLRAATRALQGLRQTTLETCSRVYRSTAVGPGQQPDYLNAVVQLETELAARELLSALQGIEDQRGRERLERWGPRTLDLDLLLYGGDRIDTAELQVPHPRIAERNFVLYPLLEIAGANWLLPDGRELGTLVALCPRGELADTSVELGAGRPA